MKRALRAISPRFYGVFHSDSFWVFLGTFTFFACVIFWPFLSVFFTGQPFDGGDYRSGVKFRVDSAWPGVLPVIVMLLLWPLSLYLARRSRLEAQRRYDEEAEFGRAHELAGYPEILGSTKCRFELELDEGVTGEQMVAAARAVRPDADCYCADENGWLRRLTVTFRMPNSEKPGAWCMSVVRGYVATLPPQVKKIAIVS